MVAAYRSFTIADGVSNVTINKPTGTANGDVLLLFVSGGESPTVQNVQPGDITGGTWTALISTLQSDGFTKIYTRAFYKIASSEPSSYTITDTASAGNLQGTLVAVSGADTSATPVAVGSIFAGGSPRAPAITPAGTNDLNSIFMAFDCGGIGIFTDFPSGYNQHLDHYYNFIATGYFDKQLTSGSALPQQTACEYSTGENYGCIVNVCVKSAGGGPTVVTGTLSMSAETSLSIVPHMNIRGTLSLDAGSSLSLVGTTPATEVTGTLSMSAESSMGLNGTVTTPGGGGGGETVVPLHFGESFDKANSNVIGPDLTWTSLNTTWATSGNIASNVSAGGNRVVRAEHDTATANQYVEATLLTLSSSAVARLCARFSASSTSFYAVEADQAGTMYLIKFVGSTRTEIASASQSFASLPGQLRLEVEDDELRGYWNGTLVVTGNDSSITTDTRFGFGGVPNGAGTIQLDDFTAGDLNRAPWLDDWAKRRRIWIDQSKIDSDLTYYPLPVCLTGLTDIFSDIGTNSKKIAVTAGDGTTQLFAEIERWTSTEAILWVSKSGWVIDSSANNYLYLYWDASKADNTAQVGDAGSRTEVWDADFAVVNHMTGLQDSTSNNLDASSISGTGGATVSQITTGPLGKGAYDSAGVGDHIEIPDSTVYNQPRANFGVEIWIREDTFANFASFLEKGLWGAGFLELSRQSTNAMSCLIKQAGGTINGISATSNIKSWLGTPGDTDFHQVVLEQEVSGNGFGYLTIDGALDKTDANGNGNTSIDNGQPINLPGSASGHSANCAFTEFRISLVRRSAAWHKATYNALRGTLLTIESAENAPAGGGPTVVTGTLSLSAETSLSLAATRVQVATLGLSSDSSLTVVGTRKTFSTLALQSDSSLTVAGIRKTFSTLALQSDSSLTVAGIRNTFSTLALTQDSSLTVAGIRNTFSTLALVQDSSLTVAATRTQFSTLTLTQDSSLAVAGIRNTFSTLALTQDSSFDLAATKSVLSSLAFVADSSLSLSATRTQYSTLAFVQDGSFNLTAIKTTFGVANWSADSFFLVGVSGTTLGTLSFSANSSLSLEGVRATYGLLTLDADGTMLLAGSRTVYATLALDSTSDVSLDGHVTVYGQLTLNAEGLLTLVGVRVVLGTLDLSSDSEFTFRVKPAIVISGNTSVLLGPSLTSIVVVENTSNATVEEVAAVVALVKEVLPTIVNMDSSVTILATESGFVTVAADPKPTFAGVN